jgi:regulation of enolase protein 1 (concanavalin A-like superfamily)
MPGSWLDQDVGTPYSAGSATYSSGAFTVADAGQGIQGTADAFHFAYLPLAGDGSIVARVATMQGGGTTQAGVMIRETLTAGSTDVFAFFQPTSAAMYVRATTGASNAYQGTSFQAGNYPYWVKLTRSGNAFTGYVSGDGINWTLIGNTTVVMASSVYVGLAVGSQGAIETATFDNVSISTSASAAPFISSLSATTGAVGSQVTITGSNFGATQSTSVVTLNASEVTVNSWSNTSIVFTIPASATSGPVVVSVASNMNDSNPVNFAVTTQPLPNSWLDQDVGIYYTAGSATSSGGTFSIVDAAQGFQGTADAFHFVYQPLAGDGTIIARVATLQGGGTTQAGVMIRESLNANSTEVFAFFQPNTAGLYVRSTTGASLTYQGTSFSAGYYPYWNKLTRSGNVFTAYVSTDGINWTSAGSTTLTMASNVYVGLAVGSQASTAEAVTFPHP